MNPSISSLQIARTFGSSFFIASGVNGGSSSCLAGLCCGGSEGVWGEGGGRRLGPDRAHDDAARRETFSVVGNLLHRLVSGRQITAEKAFGVNHRAFGAQFVPDRERIFGPARISVVEIV